MKQNLTIIKTLLLSILLLSISSCSKELNLLNGNKEFKYRVEGGSQTSFLTLSYSDEFGVINLASMFYDQVQINWKYEDLNGNIMDQKTLGTDLPNSFAIHSPRNAEFPFTEVAPFPDITLPPSIGLVSDIDLTITKYPDFKDGFLEGKVLKQIRKVVSKIDTTINGKKYNECYYSLGYNTNYTEELGTYTMESYFVEGIGFVLLKYTKPDKSVIKLILE